MLKFINNEIFIYFCMHPHSSKHIRELARILKISPPKCLYLIDELYRNKLVEKKEVGRSILINPTLNDKFIFCKKWANLFLLIDCGLASKISEKNPQTVILFGSYSRGEDNEMSDIDIAVDIVIKDDLSSYEKKLSRKIQLHKISDSMPDTLKENIRQGILLDGIMI